MGRGSWRNKKNVYGYPCDNFSSSTADFVLCSKMYSIYLKYWDTITPFHTYPKNWTGLFHYRMCLSENWVQWHAV